LLRSETWGHCDSNAGIGASYFLRTRTKAEHVEISVLKKSRQELLIVLLPVKENNNNGVNVSLAA